MDRRCGTRRKADIAISIHVPGTGWVCTRMRDVSMSGLFLMESALRFPLHSVVKLSLAGPESAEADGSPCFAMVVRSGPEGAGLMFDEFGPAEIRKLLSVLEAPLAATRAARRVPFAAA